MSDSLTLHFGRDSIQAARVELDGSILRAYSANGAVVAVLATTVTGPIRIAPTPPDFRAIAILALNAAGAGLPDNAPHSKIRAAAKRMRGPGQRKPSRDLKTYSERLNALEEARA